MAAVLLDLMYGLKLTEGCALGKTLGEALDLLLPLVPRGRPVLPPTLLPLPLTGG